MRLIAIVGVLSSALFLRAEMPPVPRPAPEFVIQYNDGHQALLSSFRGKVVALELLYTTCPHCQHSSQVFSKLNSEFASKGFQPLGVAFNEMPQIVWIDRKGIIRSQTPPLGDEKQLQENYWREMIETLSKEPETVKKHTTARPTTARKGTS